MRDVLITWWCIDSLHNIVKDSIMNLIITSWREIFISYSWRSLLVCELSSIAVRHQGEDVICYNLKLSVWDTVLLNFYDVCMLWCYIIMMCVFYKQVVICWGDPDVVTLYNYIIMWIWSWQHYYPVAYLYRCQPWWLMFEHARSSCVRASSLGLPFLYLLTTSMYMFSPA